MIAMRLEVLDVVQSEQIRRTHLPRARHSLPDFVSSETIVLISFDEVIHDQRIFFSSEHME